MQNEKTISELLSSLNDSIEDIRNNPTQVDRLPSNFEIMVGGASGETGIGTLFSPAIDAIIGGLFDKIQNMDFEYILNNVDKLKDIIEAILGPTAFKGPISNDILNNIQKTMTSEKYIMAKSWFGKTMTTLKKIRIIIRNLEKDEKKFKNNPIERKKYQDAVYAIKQVLKFVAIIYKNRQIINRRVVLGMRNIVYESDSVIVDEWLVGWEDF